MAKGRKDDNSTNICFLCGKKRITISSHKELVGNSVVVVTQTCCSDPKCQAKVDRQLEKEKKRREEIQSESVKRKSPWLKNIQKNQEK